MKKAQSAMEFLMNYGWAILVVIVGIGVLAYFGVVNPENIIPERCSMASGFKCQDYVVSSNGIQVTLMNALGKDVVFKKVSFSSDALPGPCSSQDINVPVKSGESVTLYADNPSSCISGSENKKKYDIALTYTLIGSTIGHTLTGEIFAKLEPGVPVGGGGAYGGSGGGADSCSDTDGGDVKTVLGTAFGYYNNVSYSSDDSCVDSASVTEYYCTGTVRQSSDESCGTDGLGASYCTGSSVYADSTDYYCQGGACSSSSNPVLQQDCDINDSYSTNYCIGTIVYRNFTDSSCSSGVCSSTRTAEFVQNCSFGCSGGACNSPGNDSCADTDSGNISGVFGTISGVSGGYSYSYPDYCINTSFLREYYCSGSSNFTSQYSCGVDSYSSNYCSGGSVYRNLTDYYCGSGKCNFSRTAEFVQTCSFGCTAGVCDSPANDSCADTDGGNVPAVKGTMSGTFGGVLYNKTDYCINTTQLREFFCSGSYQQNNSQSCGVDSYSSNYCLGGNVYRNFSDYFCVSGACGVNVSSQFVQTCSFGCTGGVCNIVTDSCADTDSGVVLGVFGSVSGNSSGIPYSYSDSCISAGNLREFYCSGSSNSSSAYSCGTDFYSSNYCLGSSVYRNLTDYFCSAGVCSSSRTAGLVETCTYGCTGGVCDSPSDSCADTDGGNVAGAFGTVSGLSGGVSYSYPDYCVNTATLREFYCSGTANLSSQQSCGTDFYSSNYCSGGSVYRDFTDYYCASGVCASNLSSQLVQTCSFGCTGGVCNTPPADSCADTDGGIVLGVFGTISGLSGGVSYSSPDSCVDASNLREFYCSGTANMSGQYSCGVDSYSSNYCSGSDIYRDLTDYYCSAGACSSSVTPQFVQECNDAQYCNGEEQCALGSCQAGIPVVCNDAVACTADSCNEITDSCDYTPITACINSDGCCPAGCTPGNDNDCTGTLCWSGSNQYLLNNLNNARKFCKCAANVYGYKTVYSTTASVTAYKYTDTADNTNWAVSTQSATAYYNSVKCVTGGVIYYTNVNYYAP